MSYPSKCYRPFPLQQAAAAGDKAPKEAAAAENLLSSGKGGKKKEKANGEGVKQKATRGKWYSIEKVGKKIG